MTCQSFRTEISITPSKTPIRRDERLVLLGSCFADSVGSLLVRDGFNASVNAMGALYNPLSMARTVGRALDGTAYSVTDLTVRDGVAHCLDYESRRQDADAERLLDRLNADFFGFSARLREAETVILTFGTAWIFTLNETGTVVGNCHKLQASEFTRSRATVDDIVSAWQPLFNAMADKRFILTVSPVRHLADGLHGNQLSKAVLLLAVERLCRLCPNAQYFHSYEIALDDLRDYRFYAPDMKHLSDTAVEYIYSHFCKTYFTPQTLRDAEAARRDARRALHRNILQS